MICQRCHSAIQRGQDMMKRAGGLQKLLLIVEGIQLLYKSQLPKADSPQCAQLSLHASRLHKAIGLIDVHAKTHVLVQLTVEILGRRLPSLPWCALALHGLQGLLSALTG